MARQVRVPGYMFWSIPMRNFHKRIRRRARGFKLPVGLKQQYIPGSQEAVETAYFKKERARRRRVNRAAGRARRLNRA